MWGKCGSFQPAMSFGPFCLQGFRGIVSRTHSLQMPDVCRLAQVYHLKKLELSQPLPQPPHDLFWPQTCEGFASSVALAREPTSSPGPGRAILSLGTPGSGVRDKEGRGHAFSLDRFFSLTSSSPTLQAGGLARNKPRENKSSDLRRTQRLGLPDHRRRHG